MRGGGNLAAHYRYAHGAKFPSFSHCEADPAKLAKLVAEPTTWFVFWATFCGAAIVPLDSDVLPQFYGLVAPKQAIGNLLVLLPIVAFGFLVILNPIARGTFLSALGTSHLPYPLPPANPRYTALWAHTTLF